MNNADMPIIPVVNSNGLPSTAEALMPSMETPITGLTKREHYAGLAMQGGWYDMTDAGKAKHYEYAARACVAMADALLAALEEQ